MWQHTLWLFGRPDVYLLTLPGLGAACDVVATHARRPLAGLVGGALGRGERAGDDPYDGLTLEWATSSPPPPQNFDAVPEVRSAHPLHDLRVAGGQPEGEAAEGQPAGEPVGG